MPESVKAKTLTMFSLEDSLQAALDIAHMGAWGWDETTGEKIWPAQTKAIFGLPPEVEMTRDLFVSLLHPDDVPRYRDAWAAAMNPAGGRIYELTYRICRANDGAERWIHSKARVEFDGASPVHVLGALRDITEEQATTARLRESEQQLSLFIEHAPASIAMFDRTMRYLAASARWNSDYGLAHTPVGRSHYDVFPEISEAWKAVHRRCLAGAVENCDGEMFARADGSAPWIKWEVRPWRDERDEIGGIIISSEDITARKEAEALSVHLAAIVASSTDAIISKSLDGEIMSWNAGAARLFGHAAQDMVGRPLARIIPPEWMQDENRILARLRVGERIENYETQRLTSDGRRLDVSLTISPVRDAAGKIIGASKIARDITERKRMERALRESEERLRFALSGAQAAAWQWNLATGELIWSPECSALFGRDPHALARYELWRDCLHPEDLAPTERLLQGIIARREPEYRAEYRVILPSGDIRWLSSLGRIEYDADGAPARMSGINLDITEQKRAQDAVREREQRLTAFLENSSVFAWLKDENGRYQLLNRNFQRRLGNHFQLGKTDHELWPQAIADQFVKNDRAVLAAGQVMEVVEAAQDSDGGLIWCHVNKFSYRDGAGRRFVGGLGVDITARIKAEAALHDSEALFRAVFEQSAVGVAIGSASADGGFLRVNPRFSAMLGYDDDELIGRTFQDVTHPDDRETNLRHVNAILAGEVDTYRMEKRYLRQDGAPVWVDVAMALVRDTKGAPAFFIGTFIDISARKTSEQALLLAKAEAERADLAKSKFLAAASHDLRQPVQSLTLLLSVIERQVADKPKAANMVEMAKASMASLNGMLTGILDISRLDAGVITPVAASVDVGDLVDRLAREYATRAEAVGLELRHATRALRAHTDGALLERILRNLIENALRFTEEGGVLIGARQRGERVRLDIIDTGIGIPAEQQTEIFEEFRQLGNPARDSSRGLGLGLAIVSRLACLLGAEVQVASRVGRGARFSLFLPLDRSTPPRARATPAIEDAGGRILIIEDNSGIRQAYEIMLKEWGYETLSAGDGEEALALAAQSKWEFDAIIADHRLGPGLTGNAAAAEIARQAGRAFPTMLVTGDTDEERLTEVSASGFALLHKPVAADDLRRALASLLGVTAGLKAQHAG